MSRTWTKIPKSRYDEMLGVLPPAVQTGAGFLLGEPRDHAGSGGEPRFAAFVEHVVSGKPARHYESSEPLTVDEFRAISAAEVAREAASYFRLTAKDTRALLVEMFPACIQPQGAPKLPLKIGIDKDIRAAAPQIGGKALWIALQDYTGGKTYQRALVAGAARIGLDGQPAGVVTEQEAAHARHRLRRRPKAPGAPRPARRHPQPQAAVHPR